MNRRLVAATALVALVAAIWGFRRGDVREPGPTWFPRSASPGIGSESAVLPGVRASADASADGERPVRGIVVDAATGLPLKATVRLLHTTRDFVTIETAETESSADGLFEFPPQDLTPSGIAAKAPGYAIARRMLDDAREARLALDRSATVVGRVLDEHGEGIAGASVWVTATSSPQESEGTDLPMSEPVTSGARGRYEILDAPIGGLRLDATARGHLHVEALGVEIRDMTPGSLRHADIVLRRAAILRGVLTANGRPVANGFVQAATASDELIGEWTQSASDGSWLLFGVPAGPILVVGTHPDHGLASARVEVAAGDERDVPLDLVSNAPVEGRVLDGRGVPVPGALVWCGFAGDDDAPIDDVATRGRWAAYAHTDAEGRFRLAGLVAGPVELRARARGGDRGIQVVTAPARDVEIRFENRNVISGRVVDPGGAPVRTGSIDTRAASLSRRDVLRPDGTFSIGFSETWPARVSLVYRGDAGSIAPLDVAIGTRDLELHLEPAPEARGRVVDASGAGVGGAWIGVADRRGGPAPILSMRRASARRTTADGRYAIPLEIGTNDVVVWRAGYASSVVRHVQARSSDAIELADVVLEEGRGSSVVPVTDE